MTEERIPNTEKLARALEELKAPLSMIENARKGVYDDFKSQHELPLHVLVADAYQADLPKSFIDRVMDGDFDAEPWESEEWFTSEEGQNAMRDLLGWDEEEE